MLDVKKFIKKYEKYYFGAIEDSIREEIGYLNTVDESMEQYIVEEKLKKGIYDEETLAWKAGRIKCISNDKSENEKETYYLNGYGNHISKKDFSEYLDYINTTMDELREIGSIFDKDDGHIWKMEEYKKIDWEESYRIIAGEKILSNETPRFLKGFGPVNVINAMFFLSRGKAPIYDSFAHKAVRALVWDINPSRVYMGDSPDRRDVHKVVIMYTEYISLLEKVFHDYIGNDNMFIPRSVDRALWVYGHSKTKYEES